MQSSVPVKHGPSAIIFHPMLCSDSRNTQLRAVALHQSTAS